MKILHTADWHLGHRLHEQSQNEEQQLFLNWLSAHILAEKYDVLLISGDVFDTGMPSSQSLNMYYNFLIGLNNSCCKYIVITGGNHDSPGTLNAPKELLSVLDIKVVGKATDPIKKEVFKLTIKNEEVIVGAVPYLRDQDVRKAIAGEDFLDINDRYKKALIQHYTEIATYSLTLKENKEIPIIAMGHLFAIGGSISDSEKDISVGNLGHIGADDFSDEFDYVALGHLHKPQRVGGKAHIRYSGSPVMLSFSETNYDKKIVKLQIEETKITEINEITVPKFRNILKIKGSVVSCINQLKNVTRGEYNLAPWIEIILDENATVLDISEIKKSAEELLLKILKITLSKQEKMVGLEVLLENVKNIKTLKPLDVFTQKCQEQGKDLSEHKDILEAFNEALQIAQEQHS